jgi:UDP-glucose 4-epimerase
MSGAVVAITGATSFLGRNLLTLLEDDERVARVIAIDVKPPRRAGRKTNAYTVDFTEA